MKGTTGSLWEWFLGQHSEEEQIPVTGICSRHFAGRPRIDRPQERDFTPILCFHRSRAILLFFFFAVLPVTRSLSCDGASVALASLLEVDIRKDLFTCLHDTRRALALAYSPRHVHWTPNAMRIRSDYPNILDMVNNAAEHTTLSTSVRLDVRLCRSAPFQKVSLMSWPWFCCTSEKGAYT